LKKESYDRREIAIALNAAFFPRIIGLQFMPKDGTKRKTKIGFHFPLCGSESPGSINTKPPASKTRRQLQSID
jgi:hypothetical protein